MVAAVGFTARGALEALSDLVQAGVDPTLTDAELGRLLRVAAVADEDGNLPDAWPAWAASTAYPVNERVVPATRNGYVYKVVTAGTSGASAPSWATTIGNDVTDGSVVWDTEATAPWTPTYAPAGLNTAAALAKATGKAVEVKVIVDPTVLGGVVTQVGDTVIDGTVRHRLEQLREVF